LRRHGDSVAEGEGDLIGGAKANEVWLAVFKPTGIVDFV